MITKKSIRAIRGLATRCDEVSESGNVASAEELCDLIISTLEHVVPKITNGLSQYAYGGTVDYLGDLKILRGKLEIIVDTEGEFLVGQSVDKSIKVTNAINDSGNSTNTNSNTNANTVNNTIDFKVELAKVREQLENDEVLDDDAKEEIHEKLNEIESVMDEDPTNNEKWKKLKGFVNWATTKGYRVGKIVMPFLIKTMFPEAQGTEV